MATAKTRRLVLLRWGAEGERAGMTNQEAIRILDEQRNKFMDEYVDYCRVNEAYNMAIQSLKEQSAKRGHWISVHDGEVVSMDNNGCPERACFCSECKTYLDLSEEYAVHGIYCPVCGAKMEGR